MSWSVVTPTNRPEQYVKFLRAWNEYFTKHDVYLIVVQDNPTTYPEIADALKSVTYDYKLINWSDVGADYIPHKTDMVRSWGFYEAYKTDCDYIITLDDDVVPVGDVFEEYEQQFMSGGVLSEYLSVGALTSTDLQMRGFPYKDRVKKPVAVQYGGWSGVLDYDAATQLAVPKRYESFGQIVMPVPKGSLATCCIMNTAWQREYTPIMWQLTMLDGRYNRIGDIWSGIFIKRVLDSIGTVMLINGKASVEHDRASNPYNSLQKEAPSVLMNESIGENIHCDDLDMIEAYKQATDSAYEFFMKHDIEYAKYFLTARDEWLGLFR